LSTERVERRLTAILAADVAGYSRLMGADEEGTLAQLKAHRRALVDPKITEHRGRIVKTTGDGMLAEFASVVDAVRCAVEVQRGMAERNADVPLHKRIEFRVGINIGDIVIEGGDIFGDGVNIAARLEGIADPGGIYISRQAYDQVEGKLALNFRELGPQTLKNISKPVEVYAINCSGVAKAPRPGQASINQEIRYCRASDGVRLAYAMVGQGPPLVMTANWFNHLEYDWKSPIRRHILRELASNHTLIRYDARGNGLSDWEVDELSLEAWVSDLKTVVDAAGVQRFVLLGISQGCAISIAFAVRYPERVSHLILYGGFALGLSKRSASGREELKAMATLMRLEWAADNPAIRQMFTTQFFPECPKELTDWFNELQRLVTSGECAARYLETTGDIDVTELLPKVAAPTLVMHRRSDVRQPIEEGRRMAAGIRGARFVALEGRNHIPLEHEPAAQRFFEEIRLFLGEAAATER
jgi:class 3 adenylate cyclase/pimeloyl-ACP methyl ester carboxylesterase